MGELLLDLCRTHRVDATQSYFIVEMDQFWPHDGQTSGIGAGGVSAGRLATSTRETSGIMSPAFVQHDGVADANIFITNHIRVVQRGPCHYWFQQTERGPSLQSA